MKNWKTTLAGIGAALASLLTALAMIPHDTGLQQIPEPWRGRLLYVGIISALALKVVNSLLTADAEKKEGE